MLVAPSSVRTYGDLGEWALGKWGRFITVASQMGVCPAKVFWIIFMAIMVAPMCLIPTLKEGASMAFAGCMGTIIADIITVVVLQWNMRGHDSIPTPDLTLHQVLTCFGNLALAYGAAIVVPDLQREHSQPQRMPRVVVITILFISFFFVFIALAGYTAAGCQLSGNILYSIVNTSDPLGLAPLGFSADRGAVVMAASGSRYAQEPRDRCFQRRARPGKRGSRHGNLKEAVIHAKFDANGGGQASGVCCKYSGEGERGRMSHLRVALEFGEEISEAKLSAPYRNNPLRHIALRLVIVAILVVVAVLARKRFIDLQDFTGATARTTSYTADPSNYLHACVLEDDADFGQVRINTRDSGVRLRRFLRDDTRR
ncbi:unnamed protein product [Peronospora belbahrii]|nr:unnamed protein product [Peronospora belbahrii]